jgi:hypothetical protein
VRHRASPAAELSLKGQAVLIAGGRGVLPLDTQIFQLRQQVKMGKVEVTLALTAAAATQVVTKELAVRRKLKKVGSGIPVI